MNKCKHSGCDNAGYGVTDWCSDKCLDAWNKEQREAQIASNYEKGCFQWGPTVKSIDTYIRAFQGRVKAAFEKKLA